MFKIKSDSLLFATIVRILLLGIFGVSTDVIASSPPYPSQTARGFQAFYEAEHFGGTNAGAGRWNVATLSNAFSAKVIVENGLVTNSNFYATNVFVVPAAGIYNLWFAHSVSTNKFTTFDCQVFQNTTNIATLVFAPHKAATNKIDSDYIYQTNTWNVWSRQSVTLNKGEVTIKLAHNATATTNAQVDAFQVVGDPAFVPTWDNSRKEFSYFFQAESMANLVQRNPDYSWNDGYWNQWYSFLLLDGSGILDLSVTNPANYATTTFAAPTNGTYYVWAVHELNTTYLTPFNCIFERNGTNISTLVFGPHIPLPDLSDPDYYFQYGSLLAWSRQTVNLTKGINKIKLAHNNSAETPMTVDAFHIVQDVNFIPEWGNGTFNEVLPDVSFRVRPNSFSPTISVMRFSPVYTNVIWTVTNGTWSAWIKIKDPLKAHFQLQYPNLGGTWPFVCEFTFEDNAGLVTMTNSNLSFEWTSTNSAGVFEGSGSFTSTYVGNDEIYKPNQFNLYTWKRSFIPGAHVTGNGGMYAMRYMDYYNTLGLSTNNLPKKFITADRWIGNIYEKEEWETGLSLLAKLGFNTIQAEPYANAKTFLAGLGVTNTMGAAYWPPCIHDTTLSETSTAGMDAWAQSMTNEWLHNGWQGKDFRLFPFGDEVSWYQPYQVNNSAGTGMPGAFTNYLKAKGFTPAFFGNTLWSQVGLTATKGTTLNQRKKFYWTHRFYSDNSADVFGRYTKALEKAFGNSNSLNATVNWNNWEARYYTPGLAGYNPNPTHVGVASGYHDWLDFGRKRGCTALWTEDWDFDSNAKKWSTLASKLRSGSSYYNTSRTNGSPSAIKFGGFIIGQTSGDRQGGFTQKLLALFGHGGKTMDAWTFGPAYNYSDNNWSENFALYGELGDAFRMIGGAEDMLYPAQPIPSQVAILQPGCAQAWDGTNLTQAVDYMAEAHNIYQALAASAIQADWIDETALTNATALAGIKCLFITTPNLATNMISTVTNWVNSGGVGVFTIGAGRSDMYDDSVTNLNSILGITNILRKRVYSPTNAAVFTAITPVGATPPAFNARGFAKNLVTNKASTRVVAQFGAAPAITTNKFGSGVAMVYGTLVGTAYTGGSEIPDAGEDSARQWLAWTVTNVAKVIPTVRLSVSNSVEAATLRSTNSPNGLTVTLLNWSTNGNTVFNSLAYVTYSNMVVKITCANTVTNLRSVKLSTNLSFSQAAGVVTVTLPTLKEADILKLYY